MERLPNLEEVRDRVLRILREGEGRGRGKGGIASTSPQYKTAAKALDKFINELQKSTPAQNFTPDSHTTWADKAQTFLDEMNLDGRS